MPILRFGGLEIQYDDRVLHPREWTRAQSARAAACLRDGPPGRLLELCAGVGHIGLLAATMHPVDAVLVDLDATACELARRNSVAAGMEHRVQVRQRPVTDCLDADEVFSVVIADPPWVPAAETDRFPGDPLHAIDGGSDGLDLARDCVRTIDRCLHPEGAAVLQLGTVHQATLIEKWLIDSPRLDLEAVDLVDHAPRGALQVLRRRTV